MENNVEYVLSNEPSEAYPFKVIRKEPKRVHAWKFFSQIEGWFKKRPEKEIVTIRY
jgi:hypothetical protein